MGFSWPSPKEVVCEEDKEAPVNVLSGGGKHTSQPEELSLHPHGLAAKEGLWPEEDPRERVCPTSRQSRGWGRDPIHP